MIADPVLENITIEDIKPNINIPPFNDPIIQNQILALLPKINIEKISFNVRNANTAIVNGIKRIISGELKTKILTCDIHDIDTNEEFIMLSELIDRINFIPIDQDISINTVFAINILNSDPKKEYMIVRSSNIVNISDNDSKNKEKNKGENKEKILPFANTFRIAELRPTKYLIISKIRVVENYGYNHAAHCLTLQSEYYITDYIPVIFVNERANFISKRVKVADLLELFKKYKIKTSFNDSKLFRAKILVIPNKSYQNQLTQLQKNKIKDFDILLENEESWEVDEPNYDDKFLKEYHSTEIKARNFYVSFKTNGNIKVKKMLIWACDNINERLVKLKEAIIEKDKEQEETKTEGFVTILRDNIKTIFIIRGEDHTISQLLKITIFELDPSIGLVNAPEEHPLNRTIMITLIHMDPVKIIIDAIDKCINDFAKIRKYF